MTIAIAELKNRLSETLRAVRRGESVTITDRGHPVARLVPYEVGTRLSVRRAARRDWRAFKLPPPPRKRTDSLAALLEERTDRV